MIALNRAHRWWIWLPLLGFAVWLAFFADQSPKTQYEIVHAVGHTIRGSTLPSRASGVASSGATQFVERSVPPLAARDQLFSQEESKPAVKDIFASKSWAPPPRPRPTPVAIPASAPTAPAIPFTYIGKKLENATWEVYVTRGEQSFILRPGSVIESTYRVQSVNPPQLHLIYLPLGQTQTLAIGESQ